MCFKCFGRSVNHAYVSGLRSPRMRPSALSTRSSVASETPHNLHTLPSAIAHVMTTEFSLVVFSNSPSNALLELGRSDKQSAPSMLAVSENSDPDKMRGTAIGGGAECDPERAAECRNVADTGAGGLRAAPAWMATSEACRSDTIMHGSLNKTRSPCLPLLVRIATAPWLTDCGHERRLPPKE